MLEHRTTARVTRETTGHGTSDLVISISVGPTWTNPPRYLLNLKEDDEVEVIIRRRK